MGPDSNSSTAQRFVQMLEIVFEGIEIQKKSRGVDFVDTHPDGGWRWQGTGLTLMDGGVVHGESTQMS